MHDIIVKNRRSFLESFIIFSVIAVGLLIYLHFNPYSYPGLSEKIYWMFAIYLIVLTAFYFFEITDYLIDILSAFIDLANRFGMPRIDAHWHKQYLPVRAGCVFIYTVSSGVAPTSQRMAQHDLFSSNCDTFWRSIVPHKQRR